MEEWAWVDERDLVPFRGARVCMTCQHFSWGVDGHCHTLLGCTLRRGLLKHGEHLPLQCGYWASVTEAGVGDTVVAVEGDAGEGTREHSVSQAFAVLLAPKQSSQQS